MSRPSPLLPFTLTAAMGGGSARFHFHKENVKAAVEELAELGLPPPHVSLPLTPSLPPYRKAHEVALRSLVGVG